MLMPYLGAPFVEEGSVDGLLAGRAGQTAAQVERSLRSRVGCTILVDEAPLAIDQQRF